MSTGARMALKVIAIAAIALATIYLIQVFLGDDESSGDSGVSFGRNHVTDRTESDWRTIEPNADGKIVDDDGFIPVSLDGGPIYLNFADSSAGEQVIVTQLCEAAMYMDETASRENRGYMYDFIKSSANELEQIDQLSSVASDVLRRANRINGFEVGNAAAQRLASTCEEHV